MQKELVIKFSLLAGSILISVPALGCTTFCVPEEPSPSPVVCNNLDWQTGHGSVVTSPRNLKKKSLVSRLVPGTKAAEWESTYGSVAITQLGEGLPYSGMNEAGLTVNIMLLPGSSRQDFEPSNPNDPELKRKSSINESQWIQYQLDKSADVREAIKNAMSLAISPMGSLAMHYMICDAQSECATFEYKSGKLIIHTTLPISEYPQLPPSVEIAPMQERSLANDFYSSDQRSQGNSRFKRAAVAAKKNPGEKPVDFCFGELKKLSMAPSIMTPWSVVMEPKSKKFHFRAGGESGYRSIDFAALDKAGVFNCSGSPTFNGVLDIRQAKSTIAGADANQDVIRTQFLPENRNANLEASKNFIEGPLVKHVIQEYPKTVVGCAAPSVLGEVPNLPHR